MIESAPPSPPSQTAASVMATVRTLMGKDGRLSFAGDFRVQDIVVVARHAMVVVDTYPALRGPEKKRVVLDVTQRLMDEVDHRTWLSVKPIAVPIVNAAIDELVDAHKGKLRLRPRWRRLLQKCCTCCDSSKK